MDNYKIFLISRNLSNNTISAYITAVKGFFSSYSDITKKNLLAWKASLIDNSKAKTVNLKIQAMNKYLEFIKKQNLKIKAIKVQQKSFLENVISDADYVFLKKELANLSKLKLSMLIVDLLIYTQKVGKYEEYTYHWL